MLASLITVALMASANASPLSLKVQEKMAERHATNAKLFRSKATTKTTSVAPLGGDSGYVQVYNTNGACTDDSTVEYIFTAAYGMCFMDDDAAWSMTTLAQNEDLSWNVTTTVYDDEECTTSPESSMFVLPGTCADSSPAMGDDDYQDLYWYAAGTMKKFAVDSKTYGEITYDSADDCAKESMQMSATSYLFQVCMPLDFNGINSYYVSGCDGSEPSYTAFSDSDCTVKWAPDAYSGDDGDDNYGDFYGDECIELGDYEYTSDYCQSGKSAASALVTPSKMLLIAATAAAAVASMF